MKTFSKVFGYLFGGVLLVGTLTSVIIGFIALINFLLGLI